MTSNRARNAVALVFPALLLAFLAGLPAKAMAQPTYDKKIAKATADIVAQKLGSIRGSFGPADEVVMLPDLMRTFSVPSQSRALRPAERVNRTASISERHLRDDDLARVRVVHAGLM